MQAQMSAIQEELAHETVEGLAGGGMVKVAANGQGEILSVKISPEVVNPEDVEMLEDLVLAAIKEALRLSHELSNNKLSQVTGGLDMSGLM